MVTLFASLLAVALKVIGTGGRIRTDTLLPTGDFESPASIIIALYLLFFL